MSSAVRQGGLVALLAEGVDRNKFTVPFEDSEKLSPSSRRAWIEIQMPQVRHRLSEVALLAEGVDRNILPPPAAPAAVPSPSSRRAWIEIVKKKIEKFRKICRPPRGGRG